MDEDEADEDDEDNDDVVGAGGGGSENGEEAAAPPQPAVKVKRVVSTTNNLARFLEYLLKLLQKKDTNEFFANPVNDQFAPGYSSIIRQPMDFSTIRYSRLLVTTKSYQASDEASILRYKMVIIEAKTKRSLY